MELVPGALQFLDELRAAGTSTTIITNLTTEIQLKKMVKLGIHEYFDFIVTSEEIGVEKPDRMIFENALKLNSAKPKDCIMFGDDYTADILSAVGLGMKAYYRTDNKLSLKRNVGVVSFNNYNQFLLVNKNNSLKCTR